jgi:hypothetical protein
MTLSMMFGPQSTQMWWTPKAVLLKLKRSEVRI